MNTKKKNNKGFTLVELIIVIAVIAILAAVLAPRYIQYVERSRETNDLQVAASLMRAATTAIADPANGIPSGQNYVVTWSTSGTAPSFTAAAATGTGAGTTAGATALQAAIVEIMGTGEEGQSAIANATDFSFTINTETGVITLSTAAAGTAAAPAWGDGGIGVSP